MNNFKNTTLDLIPGDIFHPGEILKDELDARNLSQQKLAEETGMSKSEVSLIVNGRRNITPLIAVKLESILEIKAEFWMNLQVKYEIDKIKLSFLKKLKEKKKAINKRVKKAA
jgi:HTH-type transcriptional regulator/antitoxin HigA